MINLNQSTVMLKDQLKSVVVLQEMASSNDLVNDGFKVHYPEFQN